MTQDNSNNFRPLPAILMVIILAAIAAGGWWIKSRPPAPAADFNTHPTSPQLPTPPSTQQMEMTLFVPNNNAMLEKQTDKIDIAPSASFTGVAKKAFALLQEKAPKNYPKGAELLDAKIDDGTAVLDFNAKFNEASFWQGSSRTLMAIYSIVNTITALPGDDFKAQQVRFLVEGKPIAVLGDFDVNDPLKPEMQWVQKN